MKYYYHTGTNSFDNPQIKEFGIEGPAYMSDFGWGPFEKFSDAKRDLNDLIKNDIANLKDLYKNVSKLRK
jgi:hypothetical protein